MTKEENSTDSVILPTDDTTTSGDITQLTSKNSDYIHSVTRQLMLAGKTDEQVKTILADIVPQILEAQRDDKTARSLFGTPTTFVSSYTTADKKQKEAVVYTDNAWLNWLDSVLLVFSLLAGVNGLTSLFQKGASGYGLTALILSSLAGGAALFTIANLQTAQRNPNAKKRFRGYYMLMMIASFVLWFGVTYGALLLPVSLNPQFPGAYLIVAAVVVFGIRYLLRRRYHIRPSLFSMSAAQERQNRK